MKFLTKVFVITFALSTVAEAQSQYPYKTIQEIQYCSIDSLANAEILQNAQPARYTLQASSMVGDTVRIIGVCIVPTRVINFTAGGYTMILADTGAQNEFNHIFVRASIAVGDTQSYTNMYNVEEGDIVEVTGYISEFPITIPQTSMNTYTQIVPLRDPNFILLDKSELPYKREVFVNYFYEGIQPGKIIYTTGEPYESEYVYLTNLTVVGRNISTTSNVTMDLVDDYGNMISVADHSRWFTMRGHRDPSSTFQPGDLFARIDTIRGYITSVSGSNNSKGYLITPIYTGDIVYGIPKPSISRVRRYPVIVNPDSSTIVEAVISSLPNGGNIINRMLYYSVNDEPFVEETMQMVSGDTLFRSYIPIEPVGTTIKYFIKVVDDSNQVSISANGAGSGMGSDTSKGFYFYKVTDGNLTIHDVQYTPYLNGRSAYVGGVTTIRGIVTADTSEIGLTARNAGGTSSWYMQSGTNLASGIWFNGTISALQSLKNGDSVAIAGTIQEQFDVTRIGYVSDAFILSVDNPIPEPVMLTTGIFGPGAGNGDLDAEPWEGMLVEFDTVTVINVWPTFSDPTEYTVDDGTGEIIVRRDGMNTYSNVVGDTIYPGTTIIKVGDKFSKLRGIVFYSFNRYKIVPRTNADFGTYIPLSVSDRIDGPIPTQYQLSNNYPNPFNPTTVIEYALPREDKVSLKIYNVIGQEVATLKNEIQKAGTYRVSFDGAKLATGVYFYRLQTSGFNQVKKMLLVK